MGGAHSIFKDLDPSFPAEARFYHFRNLSNTCFCNSVLQALTNSKNVQKYFKEIYDIIEEHPELNKLKRAPLIQFNGFYEKQFSSKKREFYIKPKKFLHFVRKETDQFPRGEQHDSHEFLMFLLDSFDKTIDEINENDDLTQTKLKHFSSLFEGKKELCFKCTKCETNTCKYDHFCCLYIGLENIQCRPLQDLIDASFKDETLTGNDFWECDNCHEKQKATISSCLTLAPKVLVVQLQRFYFNKNTNSLSKMLNYVQIPKKVKLNQCNQDVVYSLKSIIIHIGRGLQKGHYIALNFVCGSWILANDNELYALDQADLDEYLGQSACLGKNAPVPYLLFYERDV